MSDKHLSTPFDIHGGGIDLTFPHHENEVAQSRCCFGTDTMAQVWMHNGYLQVEGKKMSKSEGNFITINELLSTEKFGGHKWSGKILRLAMLMTHYRQPIDWTVNRLQEAEGRLINWLGPPSSRGLPEQGTLPDDLVESLSDDINTVEALSVLDKLASLARSPSESNPADKFNDLAAALVWLGLADNDDFEIARADSDDLVNEIKAATVGIDKDQILALITARIAARDNKDWAEADRIRDELEGMGIQLMDAKDPDTGEITTTWEVKR